MNKESAIEDLEFILERLDELHDEAVGIIEEHFPEEINRCKSYDIITFGRSSNPYDSSFSKMIQNLRDKNNG